MEEFIMGRKGDPKGRKKTGWDRRGQEGIIDIRCLERDGCLSGFLSNLRFILFLRMENLTTRCMNFP
jgi:hypothetical protein